MDRLDNRQSLGIFARATHWVIDADVVDRETARRRRILVFTIGTYAVTFFVFFLRRLTEMGPDFTAILIAAATATTAAAPLTIRRLGRHEPALVLTLITGILSVSAAAYVNGGIGAPAATAFPAISLLAIFVGGQRAGLAAVAAAGVALALLWLIGPMPGGPPAPGRPLTRLLSIETTTFAVYALARVFEEERARSAEAIARSHADFQRLVDRSRDAIVVVRDGRIAYANSALADLFGFDHETSLVGRPLVDVIHADDRDALAPTLARMLSGPREKAAEASFRRPDGERVTIVLHQVENVDFGGGEGLLLVGRDIRERKRLEAQLRMADRMASVGSLAAGVAHEVNNPLTYVMTNVSYALDCAREVRDGASTEELDDALEALSEAQDGAIRVQRIVRDLQSFSRESSPEQSQVDLREVLASAIKMAGHEVKHRAALVEDHGDDLPLVWGDEPQLAQLFLNLVINAAQAIPVGHLADHSITVRTRRVGTDDAPTAVVEVVDSGSGIDEALLDRVFDPFFTTKPVGEGTGLGLAIAHGLVTSMGGKLTLRNNPDRGATARVELPAMTRRTERLTFAPSLAPVRRIETTLAEDGTHDAQGARSGKALPKVLVVDDEPYVAQAIRRMLSASYEVAVVRSGFDALDHLTRDHYAAILCDVMMPEMSGVDLYEEVVKLLPGDEERFIFMTGGAFTAEAQTFLAVLERDGETRSMLKPFDRSEAIAAIESCRARTPEDDFAPPESAPSDESLDVDDGCERGVA